MLDTHLPGLYPPDGLRVSQHGNYRELAQEILEYFGSRGEEDESSITKLRQELNNPFVLDKTLRDASVAAVAAQMRSGGMGGRWAIYSNADGYLYLE